MNSPNPYDERRSLVRTLLGDRAVMLIAAAPDHNAGQDREFRYAVDPELFYLTGYTEPEAVLLLSGLPDQPPFTLFVRPRDPDREIWSGPRGGVEAAMDRFGADAAFPVAELDRELPAMLAGADTIHARIRTGRPDLDGHLVRALGDGRRTRPKRGYGPNALVDPGGILDAMRLVKDASEIDAMREAARITAEAFAEAAAAVRPGAGEWQVEARVEAAFRSRGASGPSFPTIAASGPNATVLHHVANDRIMEKGETLLLDAGARHGMYCADVSRTYPVGGRFSPGQRALYEVVLAARDAGIAAARPGATLEGVHDAAQRALEDGLADLGLIDPVETPERETQVKNFYPHRTSHWLGLDVHDVGDYVVDGAPRCLEPGMVFTVEPGLYVRQDSERAPAHLRGVGIRIEDDVLITEAGHEVLTAAVPSVPDALEERVGRV